MLARIILVIMHLKLGCYFSFTGLIAFTFYLMKRMVKHFAGDGTSMARYHHYTLKLVEQLTLLSVSLYGTVMTIFYFSVEAAWFG